MQKWQNRFEYWQNGVIETEEIPVTLRGLPKTLDGQKVLVVSDTHLHGETPYVRDILRLVKDVQPDAIVTAGDMVDEHTADLTLLARLLEGLRAAAPVFSVLGNNDYHWPDIVGMRRLYASCGALLLEDEMRTLTVQGGGLRLLGRQDPAGFTLGKAVPRLSGDAVMEVAHMIRHTEDQGPLIALMHQPNIAARYGQVGVSLAVSGHAHGGQFRLPFVGAVFAPGQGMFPPYTSGLYRMKDGMQLVVSRGIGNHGFPIRIGNKPHLPLIVLRRG